MRFSNEIKAGLVVIVAVLIAAVFFLKTTTLQTSKYTLKTYFIYAGDIEKDAVVKLSGIEVGRVMDVNFVYDDATKVECILELNQKARVRKDSIAYIGTSGFIGDAYIGITPGEAAEFIEPNGIVASEDPIQMRILMKKADSIANNLDKTLAEVKSLVVDNREHLDNVVVNLESTTQNFKEFSEDVKKHPWKLLFKGE